MPGSHKIQSGTRSDMRVRLAKGAPILGKISVSIDFYPRDEISGHLVERALVRIRSAGMGSLNSNSRISSHQEQADL